MFHTNSLLKEEEEELWHIFKSAQVKVLFKSTLKNGKHY